MDAQLVLTLVGLLLAAAALAAAWGALVWARRGAIASERQAALLERDIDIQLRPLDEFGLVSESTRVRAGEPLEPSLL